MHYLDAVFQHTAARRRLPLDSSIPPVLSRVSTHSRAEAAANSRFILQARKTVSTHSRAEAAARSSGKVIHSRTVSTHSRAEAAANIFLLPHSSNDSFNTQPRGGGCHQRCDLPFKKQSFNTQPRGGGCVRAILNRPSFLVSTHSRAEAAASRQK